MKMAQLLFWFPIQKNLTPFFEKRSKQENGRVASPESENIHLKERLAKNQGPVVQSILSLTSTLRGQLVKVVGRLVLGLTAL